MVIGKGSCDRALSESEVRELMSSALSGAGLDGKRVLVIIPDGTRTAPIPMMFRLFHESLNDRVEALDGRLHVESAPGRGTVIRAEIPCG